MQYFPPSGGGGSSAFVGVRIQRSSDQSIPSAALTAIDFTGCTPDYNDGPMWEAAHPTRITFTEDGVYHVGACVQWEDFSGTQRAAILQFNGSPWESISGIQEVGTAILKGTASGDYNALAGQYVEFCVYQDAGVAKLAKFLGHDSPAFWAHKVS